MHLHSKNRKSRNFPTFSIYNKFKSINKFKKIFGKQLFCLMLQTPNFSLPENVIFLEINE